MCDCRTRIDEKLKSRNARLAFGFTLGDTMELTPPLVAVEKLEPRGKKPPSLFASFCPFCGEDLRKDADAASPSSVEREAAALIVLTQYGVEPDIQELLVNGNQGRGIRAGALRAALSTSREKQS